MVTRKNPAPRKAILLAAGFGRRLRPITAGCPKPLVPLWGKSLMQHLLELLAEWGVEQVYINTHHLPEIARKFVLDLHSPLTIRLAHEPEILGTGGVLHAAAGFLDDEPFWMVNGDIAADLSPEPLLKAFAGGRRLAALWMHPTKGPRTVELKRGCVSTFRSPAPGTPRTCTFCGLHLISPRIFDYMPPPGFSTIITAYEQAMRRGEKIPGVVVDDACWADLGTPEGYVEAHREIWKRHTQRRPGRRLLAPGMLRRAEQLKARGVRIDGFAAVQAGARVSAGARLHDAIVWPACRIGPKAEVSKTIVAHGATVNGVADGGIACPAFFFQDPAIRRAVRQLQWDAAGTTVLPLPARGSARAYFRLACARKSAIAMSYSIERPENALFVRHARFLDRIGVRVPRVLHHSTKHRLAILEDLGAFSLQDAAPKCRSKSDVSELYRAALAPIIRLHSRGLREARRSRLPLNESFGPELYAWEHGLFEQHCLRDWFGLGARRAGAYRRAIEELTAPLVDLPAVLVHRDLQSSNILLVRGKPALIDFQGMRAGPAVYDLASLLCDPYVSLSLSVQEQLLRAYADALQLTPRTLESSFWRAAVQRLVQALGAFCRLAAEPGTARFEQHIGPGFDMLRRAVDRAGAKGEIWHSLCSLVNG